MIRLSILVTHPIQYQTPVWRALAARPGLAVQVGYFSEHGAEKNLDSDFGVEMAWDQPLLEGYDHEFISRRPIGEAARFRIPAPEGWLARNRPDVVFLHGYTHAFARQIIRLKNRFHYRVLLHAEFTRAPKDRPLPFRILKHLYLRWFYSRVDHFLPIGTEAVAHLNAWKIPGKRMTVAPYCVDDRLFEAQALSHNRLSCRKELGLGPDQVVFLFSGKMIPRKNPLLLVEALRNLAADPRVAVIFLGDGELKAAVEQSAKSLLGSRAVFPGFVNQRELGRYFKAADALVLPSQSEPWGLVVNEAMHFSLPCLVSDRVSCRLDLVAPGETGFIFRANDAAGLEACLRQIVETPALARSMGEKAHLRIQAFTVDKAADAIYRAALDTP